MSRYRVVQTPDQTRYVILDRFLWGWCSLVDENLNAWPLEWRSEAAAEAWLFRCRQLWGSGQVPAPDGWRPWPPEPSPWA